MSNLRHNVQSKPIHTQQCILLCQKRWIMAHDNRKLHEENLKFSAWRNTTQFHRFTLNRYKQGGVFFNSYHPHHQVWKTGAIVDHLWWERHLGQAKMPQRHQRTWFDFNDSLIPTGMPRYLSNTGSKESERKNPYERGFCEPRHMNELHVRRPFHSEKYSLPSEWNYYQNILGIHTLSTVGSSTQFRIGDIPERLELSTKNVPPGSTYGNHMFFTPGIHAQSLGEPDKKMMEAMAQNVDANNNICVNIGRYSKSIYINTPQIKNAMHLKMANVLQKTVDEFTNSLLSKLTVLKAAQSGITDFFSAGINFREVAQQFETRNETCVANAARIFQENIKLLWKIFCSKRALLTIINGSATSTGVGIALLAKYPCLRSSSEFVCIEPGIGLAPFGGFTHLLARNEVSHKFPGLAEFVVLVGAPLFSGDALRLGWSDLFSNYSDLDYYIREWFDQSEHIHHDAIAWQLSHMLNTIMKPQYPEYTQNMERVAITKLRAQWIGEIFADQQTVEDIVESLTSVENMPYSASYNTSDTTFGTPFCEKSVAAVCHNLDEKKLTWNYIPSEITNVTHSQEQNADVFTKFFYENLGDVNNPFIGTKLRSELGRWKEMRAKEAQAFKARIYTEIYRTVHVKLKLTCTKICTFEFKFDFKEHHTENANRITSALKRQIVSRMNLEGTQKRNFTLGWCAPNCETVRIRNDNELLLAILNDPGYENPSENLTHPPLYMMLYPHETTFSEWAYSVKHQILERCPFALKVSFELLKRIRGDHSLTTNSEDVSVLSVSETLSLEYRTMMRLIQRADFLKTGVQLWKCEFEPITSAKNDLSEETEEITLCGHIFKQRPRWSPKRLEDVTEQQINAVFEPLDLGRDGVCDINVNTLTYESSKIKRTINDIGIELVSRLGTKHSPNRTSAAYLPRNVNFYEMARHPWLDYVSSWRLDSYTDGSMEYLKDNFTQAEEYLYGKNPRNYWQNSPQDRNESNAKNHRDLMVERNELLQDRFWNVIHDSEKQVVHWVQNWRQNAEDSKLRYRTELTTQQEKLYDDYYYRWFTKPGEHPNPSGIIHVK